MRPEQLCSSGPKGGNPSAYLLDALVFPSLLSPYPALKHRPHRHKKRKLLLVCEGHAGFGLPGHGLALPPALRELRSPDQRKSQTKGMLALLREGECSADTLQSLLRITTQPQDPGSIHQARHPGVPTRGHGQGVMLLRLIKGNPTFQMGPGSGQISPKKETRP